MQHRRSALFADKQFQMRAAGFVCAWLLALGLIYPVIVHNLFGYFIQVIDGKKVLSATDMEMTRNKVLILLLVLEVFFIAGAFLTSIFITHRVVGPLVKLRNAMLQVADGKLNQRLQLRRDDNFHELAETYNIMVDDVRNRSERTVERLSAAVASLETALENPSGSQREIQDTLANLKTGLKELQ